jgi:hypothetical protein
MDTTNLPKTRAEAKAAGAAYYFTGQPCKHGHIAPRKTRGACVECMREEWRNPTQRRKEYVWQYNHSEKGMAQKDAYYEKNKEAVVARALTRPDHVKREYRNTWKKNNVLSIRADTKARRRKHREATPPWLSRKQKSEMRALYQIAILTSNTTGEQYVVDHIYPLRSEYVCGLHVPWNLRIITREENLRKSNALPSDEHALAHPPT